MKSYSQNCLHFRYSKKRDVVYRKMDRFGLKGYRVGSDGSVWSRLVRVPKRGDGVGAGTDHYALGSKWELLPGTNPKPGHYKHHKIGTSKRRGAYHAHTLVLMAFCGLRPTGQVCRHLDGNSLNNKLWNLKWDTPRENALDTTRHGRRVDIRGEACGHAKLTETTAREARDLYATGQYSLAQLAKRFGVNRVSILKVVRGETWSHIPFPDHYNKNVRRGYRARGEDCARAKLTNAQVREARSMYATGKYTQKELALKYNISPSGMHLILKRRRH